MKSSPFVRVLTCLLLWGCGLALQAVPAKDDPLIRLRNRVVHTAQEPPAQGTLEGLYLLQVKGPFQAEWREALRPLGVELIHYVPDQAFVVQARQTSAAALAALPFVQWVGSYGPEFKIHRGLRDAAERGGGKAMLTAKLLLAPTATPLERARLRRQLTAVSQETRWPFGYTVTGTIVAHRLGDLARSPAVLWMELPPRFQLRDEISTKIVGGDDGSTGTPAVVHQLGFDGQGVTVGVADSGCDTGDAATLHPDLAGRVDAFFYYGTLEDASDEHSHGTHVTGIIAGNAATGEADEAGYAYGLGMAPAAHIVAQRIFDGVGNYEPPSSSAALTRDALSAGAVIGSNSWGDDTQGRYDLSAAEFDALVRDADLTAAGDQPYILEFSAGNAGPAAQTMDSPAVAKNVIATGASQNDRFDFFIYADGEDAMADFSSRGPAEDGRIKPDLVAPGTWISSVKSSLASDENAWAAISDNYIYQGGTSQAGPHASGAAAVFVQYYQATITHTLPSPALVKAALIDSCIDMDDSFGTSPVPNMDEGWGRIDLTALIGSARRSEYLDQTVRLTTGQIYEHRTIVASSEEPLRITLAYTDVAASPAAIPALVNDLDLEVVGPNGLVYRGNQIENGESVPGAPSFDGLNNVEGVRLAQPPPGEYLIRVIAHNVPADAVRATASVDQDFALAISGGIPLPGVGTAVLNRRAYKAPSTLQVKLIDFDLAGQAKATVRLRSETESTPETLILLPAGSAGVFTNAMALVTGLPRADGLLQVSHGDTIEVLYDDAEPAATRVTTARVDFKPPLISNVGTTNRFGRTVVSWTTDEPADSVVRFGTNAVPAQVVSKTAYVEGHEMVLDGLEPGVTYRFSVASADEAGNASKDDQNGQYYSFIAIPAAPVLLVDAYEHSLDDEGSDIPVTEYTAALDATGIGYEVWNVAERGSPTLGDLRPFRVVVWRINDSFYDSTTLTSAQQTAIQSYLAAGGSFMMTSMEIISRLGDVPFRREVLKVGEFIPSSSPLEPCVTCDEDHGVATLVGMEGDPIGAGLFLTPDYTAYPSFDFVGIGPDVSDTFKPATNAVAICLDLDSERACGVRFPKTGEDSVGRVVFFSIPLDAIPMDGDPPNNRVHVLRQSLNFLAPGVSGFAAASLDRPAYSVPGRVVAEVADGKRAGQGSLNVTFGTDAVPSGVTVVLRETVRKGLFRGAVTLVATNAPSPSGTLRAANGDLIWVEYLDAGSGALVHVEAVVDTDPPTVSTVAVVPSYEYATVTWETSEPTDALVQFFDGSPAFPINRIAYSGDLDWSHELTLDGLRPGTMYLFQVVSRDEAGNVVVDDNHGQFYQVRTLQPLSLPYSEPFKTTSNDWSVYDDEDSQASWTLGVPLNGQVTRAFSPPNAWGSNLDGAAIDYANTALVSPAMQLAGGSTITLRFWHSFDFTERSAFDILEAGQLLLVTNELTSPVILATYEDATDGWTQVEVDLTPYLGHVVYLAFNYQLLSFDFEQVYERPGWVVDNVEVFASGESTGTLRLVSNLGQGGFHLTGPLSATGGGLETTVTNAPPGEYTVTWNPVPYYVTPVPQTNILAGAATLNFLGAYTIPDINQNGISDLWEQERFGEVSPQRTTLTDTDGDGVPDYQEFLAGTDPKNAADRLGIASNQQVLDHQLQVSWSAAVGRAYRLVVSGDLLQWAPATDWVVAVASPVTMTLPTSNAQPRFFRIEVRP